jgi:hypothetical protein
MLQNGSSRLTLVLRPPITTERFATGDFIARLTHSLVPSSPIRGRRQVGDVCAGLFVLSPSSWLARLGENIAVAAHLI